jgi:hypothetical protein
VINLSKIIHSRNFAQNITIERSSNGHFVGPDYIEDKTIITVRGIMVNPKNSKEVIQTPQGDRATGFVEVYVDSNTPLFVSRKRNDGNNISDIIIDGCGTAYEVRYRIDNVYDRAKWGFYKAEAVRLGAL